MNDEALLAVDETSPFADLARAESEVANPTHIDLPIANRRARRANHLLRLFRRGEFRSHLNSRRARLPVTRKQEREDVAKQKPSLSNSLQDCNSRFASASGGSSLYPFRIQQDRPISEAVEHTKIVATICG